MLRNRLAQSFACVFAPFKLLASAAAAAAGNQAGGRQTDGTYGIGAGTGERKREERRKGNEGAKTDRQTD